MAKRELTMRQKVRLGREFRQLRRSLKQQHPDWSLEECAAEAKEQLEAKYKGIADWDWEAIKDFLQFLFELLAPFFLLGVDPDAV